MKVFLLHDIPRVGVSGEIVKVSDGFATNFILPRKLGVLVTPENEASFKKKLVILERRKEVIESATSMLAERIKSLKLHLSRKVREDGKLFGSVSAAEVADLLSEHGVKVSKGQILLDKPLKEKGQYEITVKLSSRLQPTFHLKIVAEQ